MSLLTLHDSLSTIKDGVYRIILARQASQIENIKNIVFGHYTNNDYVHISRR